MKKKILVFLPFTICLMNLLLFLSCEPLLTLVEPTVTEEGEDGDIDGDGILDEEDSDIDGDGLSNTDESNLFGTNPRRADTDGDGWDDYVEAYTYDPIGKTSHFNPVIADMPRIQLIIEGVPEIGYKYSSTESEEVSRSLTESQEYTSSKTISNRNSRSTASEHGWSVDAMIGLEVEMGSKNTYTLTAETTVGASGSYTQESSYEWGCDCTRENTMAFEEASSFARTNEISYESGYIKIPVSIKNTSDVAYTLSAINLAAYMLNPYMAYPIEMVGNLELQSQNGFSTITINPGQTAGPFIYENNELNLQDVEKLMTKSASIITAISGYTITMSGEDGTSHDFTGTATKVASLCSEICIDYGPGLMNLNAEKYMFSARTKFNPQYTSIDNLYEATTLNEVLEILGIPFETDGTEVYSGLTSLNNVDNDPSSRSFWFVSIQEKDSDEIKLYSTKLRSFDLNTLEIHAGQKVSFIYSADGDNDGLPLRMETLVGSSDTSYDSDGDNIMDYDEIRGWERNGILYKTNPALADTDGDDIPDNEDPFPIFRKLYTTATPSSVIMRDSDLTNEWSSVISGTNIQTANISLANSSAIITTEDPVSFVKLDEKLLSCDSSRKIWTSLPIDLYVSPDGSRNHHTLTLVSEDENESAEYTLIIPSSLENIDPDNFVINEGILQTDENGTYAPLEITAPFGNLADKRINGVLIFWANKKENYPDVLVPQITTADLSKTELPEENIIYNTNSLLIYDSSSNPSPLNAYYYSHNYFLKYFTYCEESENQYTYSEGISKSFKPSNPTDLEITITASSFDLSKAHDDSGVWDQLYNYTDIDLAIDINILKYTEVGSECITDNLEGDSRAGTSGEGANESGTGDITRRITNGTHLFTDATETFDLTIPSGGNLFAITTYARECDDYWTTSVYPGEDIMNVDSVFYLSSFVQENVYFPYSASLNTSVSGHNNCYVYTTGTDDGFEDMNQLTVHYELKMQTTSVQ